MDLKAPVKSAGGIYKRYASYLEKLDIITFEDFLYHIPARYENYSLISKIAQAQPGEVLTIQGKVEEIKNEYTRNYKKLQKAKVSDETGVIDIIWFNQPFLVRNIKKGDLISLSGRVEKNFNKLVMESPEYETISQKSAEPYAEERRNETIHTGRLVPVYPETRGVSSKWLRRQVHKILQEQKQNLFEYIPDSIIIENNLMNFQDAVTLIHFPNILDEANKARERLAFDELLLMQLSTTQRRKDWEEKLEGNIFNISKFKNKIEDFWNLLSFELTNAQKKAVKEIFADLANKKPMNRLLEGDVGSGKTVVAGIAMYVSFLNGFQSVLMAPTEILAQQHYNTITNLLSPLGVKVELVTGSKKLRVKNSSSSQFSIVSCQKNVSRFSVNRLKKTEKQKTDQLNSENRKLKTENRNYFDILIGTHAVLSDKIKFEKLGLVVIDEQQRFGVEQRSIIRQKGQNPHLLTMTATPIPRTVALTMYGDLDLSYLDEMPIGRKKVKTWLVPSEKRQKAYEWIKSQLSAFNSQLFVICPFIEESESMQTVKAAKIEFERLKKEVFRDLKLGMLHGKLKAKEKEEILNRFRNKEYDILVATPVVEVGIDIPNATIILIEASERFGLSQLHQLRGRVGRGDKQSYCLLFTESASDITFQRLKAMERYNNGAELAELDLKLRGPGQIYGTKQHGVPNLKFASFSDFTLIEKTKKEAAKIFPQLSKHPLLEEKLKSISIQSVSPD